MLFFGFQALLEHRYLIVTCYFFSESLCNSETYPLIPQAVAYPSGKAGEGFHWEESLKLRTTEELNEHKKKWEENRASYCNMDVNVRQKRLEHSELFFKCYFNTLHTHLS